MEQRTTTDIADLWRKADHLMSNQATREMLRNVGYTDTLHGRFRALITNDYSADNPHTDIGWIIKPLKRFYTMLAKDIDESIQRLAAQKDESSNRVTHLFYNKVNLELQAQRTQHEYDLLIAQETASQIQESLQLIEWIAADPRFEQPNPALQGHALDF